MTDWRAGLNWSRLRRGLAGPLVLASDAEYPVAKLTEVGNFDAINPEAIAYCASPGDVSLCLRFAQDNDLPVAIRSGGHSYGGYSSTEGMVIDLSRLDRIETGADTVVLGPGAGNLKILTTLSARGQQVVGGGCPTVAAGGFIQGGGFGYLSPSIGMASDSLAEAEVVLADGRVVTASGQRHPDLFWALRGGGGGNFGVVTSFTLGTHSFGPLPVTMLSFGYHQAPAVLSAFTNWLAGKPRAIGGGAYVIQEDARPESVPAVNIMLVSTGTAAQLLAETSRLLAMAGPPPGRPARRHHDLSGRHDVDLRAGRHQAGGVRPGTEPAGERAALPQ